MLNELNRVRSATIVDRRSGPGYRIVLCLKAPSGTPVLETLSESFATVAEAERFAIEQAGVDPGQIRSRVRTSA